MNTNCLNLLDNDTPTPPSPLITKTISDITNADGQVVYSIKYDDGVDTLDVSGGGIIANLTSLGNYHTQNGPGTNKGLSKPRFVIDGAFNAVQGTSDDDLIEGPYGGGAFTIKAGGDDTITDTGDTSDSPYIGTHCPHLDAYRSPAPVFAPQTAKNFIDHQVGDSPDRDIINLLQAA